MFELKGRLGGDQGAFGKDARSVSIGRVEDGEMHRELVARPGHHPLHSAPGIVTSPPRAERFVAGFGDSQRSKEEPVEVLVRNGSGEEKHVAQFARRSFEVFEW
ncbi:hypothetical protein DDV93_14080 [Cereibacter johrii]|nr:hypothetical protein DDV93_14080 [Cereibacter johrii]